MSILDHPELQQIYKRYMTLANAGFDIMPKPPAFTEAELTELKAHIIAIQQFQERHGRSSIYYLDPDELTYALEDIDSYIAHQIHGEPYSAD